ncbi:MAG: hypothetical protein HQK76_04385 [Desulfobacterales bacterium]|nr:hypothetical protein [Desulfobacterales bacterium]
MEDHFRNHGVCVDSERFADQIKVCILLLDRLIESNYYDISFKNHNKKWGDLELSFLDNNKCNIFRPKVITEEDKIKEEKESKICCEKESNLEKQDRDYLFKMLYKHLPTWWD